VQSGVVPAVEWREAGFTRLPRAVGGGPVLSKVEDVNAGGVVHVGEDIVRAVDDLAAKVHALVDSHSDTPAPAPVSHVKVL